MFFSTESEIAASPEECRKVVRGKTQVIDPAADHKKLNSFSTGRTGTK
jgi:hypothetical protein